MVVIEHSVAVGLGDADHNVAAVWAVAAVEEEGLVVAVVVAAVSVEMFVSPDKLLVPADKVAFIIDVG